MVDGTESGRLMEYSGNALRETEAGSEELVSALKSTKTLDAYDRNTSSGRLALGGVFVSLLFSLLCIASGIFISTHVEPVERILLLPSSVTNSPGIRPPQFFKGLFIILQSNSGSSYKRELLGLALNVVVTLCTEAIGYVHAAALKSALAAESRLRFNTNLRLLTGARPRPGRFINPNGTLCNVMATFLLIISYVSSSLVFLPFQPAPGYEPSGVFVDPGRNSWILGAPVIALGLAILLQAIIALYGAYTTKILTWSSSPFDTTMALLDHALVFRYPGRCMCGVLDSDSDGGPRRPSERQPSAWQAHRSIKKIIIVLWCLIPACLIWGGIAFLVAVKVGVLKDTQQQPQTRLGSWSLLPNSQTHQLVFTIGGDQSFFSWFGILAVIGVIQGTLTIGLHCSELIVNVRRDERLWRAATSEKGLGPASNPLATVLGSWENVGLLVAKPVLHWMFGLSLNALGDVNEFSGFVDILLQVTVCMRPVQIWYLAMALLIFAVCSTLVATRRPSGPQPAAYGHIQTLADLVDEWHQRMWWGHKEDGVPICHAGTSNRRLPGVRMGFVYEGVGSLQIIMDHRQNCSSIYR